MSLRVNNNVAALNAYRNLTVSDSQQSKQLEKLSSGYRINRAADDAAGLSISEGLRSQVGGLKVAVRNAQDGISLVQTAEGALSETTSLLQRVRDLAVQAANSTNSTASRKASSDEAAQALAEIDRIAGATKFGDKVLLDGKGGQFTFQVGADSDTATNQVGFGISDMSAKGLGLAGEAAVTSPRRLGVHRQVHRRDSGSNDTFSFTINGAADGRRRRPGRRQGVRPRHQGRSQRPRRATSTPSWRRPASGPARASTTARTPSS